MVPPDEVAYDEPPKPRNEQPVKQFGHLVSPLKPATLPPPASEGVDWAAGHQQARLEMRVFAVLFLAAALGGCADTGPMSIGKDTYSTSVRVPFSGPAGAKGGAIQEASRFCAKSGKHVLLETENSHECALHGGCGEAEITFMCLDENDPRYVAPRMHQDNGTTTIKVE